MLTKLFPMVQFKKDIWEIDEFDVASMFLLAGTQKAAPIPQSLARWKYDTEKIAARDKGAIGAPHYASRGQELPYDRP